jgi:hypothetical protein
MVPVDQVVVDQCEYFSHNRDLFEKVYDPRVGAEVFRFPMGIGVGIKYLELFVTIAKSLKRFVFSLRQDLLENAERFEDATLSRDGREYHKYMEHANCICSAIIGRIHGSPYSTRKTLAKLILLADYLICSDVKRALVVVRKRLTAPRYQLPDVKWTKMSSGELDCNVIVVRRGFDSLGFINIQSINFTLYSSLLTIDFNQQSVSVIFKHDLRYVRRMAEKRFRVLIQKLPQFRGLFEFCSKHRIFKQQDFIHEIGDFKALRRLIGGCPDVCEHPKERFRFKVSMSPSYLMYGFDS